MFEVSLHVAGEKVHGRTVEDEERARYEVLFCFRKYWHPDARWRLKDLSTGRRWEARIAVGGSHVLLDIGKELLPCTVPVPVCG